MLFPLQQQAIYFVEFIDKIYYLRNPRTNKPTMNETITEVHPLTPFTPPHARILMLGSFPPPRKRWSMEFFYPNFTNDMWRIFGLIFFNDKDHFVEGKRFCQERLEAFLTEKGIALSDAATVVRRLKGNASDASLEVVETIDLAALLEKIPHCHTIVTTGQKSTDTLLAMTGAPTPPIGGFIDFVYAGRPLRLYRMPSSSRAYPKPLAEKAAIYQTLFEEHIAP